MNTATRVRQAHNPQEALLAIAEALDRIETRQLSDVDKPSYASWGTWNSSESASKTEDSAVLQSDAPADVSEDDLDDLDPAERELVIAARRRLAQDSGRAREPEPPSALRVEQGEDGATVEYLPPARARQENRAVFAATRLQLHKAFPEMGREAVAAYMQGGPMWLYLSEAGRDYILSLPVEMRQEMVRDVEQDSSRDAAELARDILKDEDVGVSPEFAQEALGG